MNESSHNFQLPLSCDISLGCCNPFPFLKWCNRITLTFSLIQKLTNFAEISAVCSVSFFHSHITNQRLSIKNSPYHFPFSSLIASIIESMPIFFHISNILMSCSRNLSYAKLYFLSLSSHRDLLFSSSFVIQAHLSAYLLAMFSFVSSRTK